MGPAQPLDFVSRHVVILESLAATAALTAITLYPVCWYLLRGWEWRRQLVTRGLRPEAKDEYLRVFQREPADAWSANERFDKFFVLWYGRRHMAIPAGFLAGVTAVASWLLVVYGLARLRPTLVIDRAVVLPWIAAASLAGAYVFATYDMIDRVTRRDLSPNDVISASFRLVVALPLGYAVQSLAPKGQGPLLAFALSAFPFAAVLAGLRKFAARQFGLDVGTDNALERVTLLAGVDLDVAERIREADITTVSQLAYSDPIQLAMRTNLGLTYMIDVVSQALAWVYLGDRIGTTRAFGLRGAFEFVVLKAELFMQEDPDDAPDRRIRGYVARQLLLDVAGALKLTPAEFLNCVHQIADDPYAEFLTRVYG